MQFFVDRDTVRMLLSQKEAAQLSLCSQPDCNDPKVCENLSGEQRTVYPKRGIFRFGMQPGTGDGNYPDKAGCSARAAAGVALLGKRADDTRVYLPASAVVPPDERVPDGKQSVRNDRERRSEQLLLFEFESAVHMGEKSGVHPAGICTKGQAPAAGAGGACRARGLFGAEKGGGAHCRKLWAFRLKGPVQKKP